MGEAWLSRPVIVASAENAAEAVVEIPADSPWFSGHFPGRPILPGVVWLYATAEVVRSFVRRDGRALDVAGFRNVRFLTPVQGAARASVVVGPAARAGADELRFEVRIGRDPICRGLIAVCERAEGGT
jgi:3-hydroxymyristoyl/3-hydroxydecanoyl-(acyl carrier protein) dehydratase